MGFSGVYLYVVELETHDPCHMFSIENIVKNT